MPEPIIGGLFALFIAIGGGSISYVLKLDRRIDALEVKIAREYVTNRELLNLDDKIDYIVTEITHLNK
jgi:hypothetical protein